MSELRTLTIFTDKPSLLILQAISDLGTEAFGMSIQMYLLKKYDQWFPLEHIYEILIDLIEEERITSRKIDFRDTLAWRKVYSIVIPNDMVSWGLTNTMYDTLGDNEPPADWDGNDVFHIGGDRCSYQGSPAPSFKHDDADGYAIVGYTSMFSPGSAGHTGGSQDGESSQT